MKPRLTERVVGKDGRVKERIEPDEQNRVMKEETAAELPAMMARVVEEGTGTAAALVGHRRGRQDRHRRGRQRHLEPGLVHRLRAGRRPADGDRGDGRAHAGPGRYRGRPDRRGRVCSRCLR